MQAKPKGVSGLIEIENPNRVVQKTKKASEIDAEDSSKAQLSRRERFVMISFYYYLYFIYHYLLFIIIIIIMI